MVLALEITLFSIHRARTLAQCASSANPTSLASKGLLSRERRADMTKMPANFVTDFCRGTVRVCDRIQRIVSGLAHENALVSRAARGVNATQFGILSLPIDYVI